MNDAKIDSELTCNPAKMLVSVREKGIKSQFTNTLERMEHQPQQSLRTIRAW